MAKEFTQEDDDLLADLGVEVETKKTVTRTPREERIIAGFEEIQRFTEQHGHVPLHGDERDIFERLYAVRLDRIRDQEECCELLKEIDHQGLLTEAGNAEVLDSEDLDDDALLAELGIDVEKPAITELKHVRSSAEKKAAEEIARREVCKDFASFKPLFDQVQSDIQAGLRETRVFERDTEIAAGQFFILGGVKAFVAKVEEEFLTPQGRPNRRMRVIYDNGTESRALMRSFQRALYKEENAGRRITDPTAGPLFSDQTTDGDEASGTIYVLRSKSDHPLIAENRDLVHKIGVTNMTVDKRIAGAQLEPTFLMANVEIVATYELYNINRTKLENLLHRIFEPARLNIEIIDRFGNPVSPREWFLVPLHVINDAVEKIKDGSIQKFIYDVQQGRLIAS